MREFLTEYEADRVLALTRVARGDHGPRITISLPTDEAEFDHRLESFDASQQVPHATQASGW